MHVSHPPHPVALSHHTTMSTRASKSVGQRLWQALSTEGTRGTWRLFTFFEMLFMECNGVCSLHIRNADVCALIMCGRYIHVFIPFTFGYCVNVFRTLRVSRIGSGCTRTPSLRRTLGMRSRNRPKVRIRLGDVDIH